MTGSGNDFVFIDESTQATTGLDTPDSIRRICSRTDGVGADGVVFLRHGGSDGTAIRYYNCDGSRGELCGNASLCTANLSVQLGLGGAGGFTFGTDVGQMQARIVNGSPEIDLQPVSDVAANAGISLERGELRIGYANTGVPHLVVLVSDAEAVNLAARGAPLRHHPTLSAGANVNFVAKTAAGWRMRTYERGVEGETLACGTGAVACAIMLASWGLAEDGSVDLLTSSGRTLTVSLGRRPDGYSPSLRGEGRIVFTGHLVDL
ncbi:MAG: diaminopimelate epimerase [Gemmatimonadetes bacterium]|nr:diaminopimelate epimerase [Gemmatimonadota bacterium]